VDAVRRLGQPTRSARVLDLYCGGGLLALALASQAGEVVGIEESLESVRDATASARLNNLRNVAFFAGRAEQRIAEVLRRWNDAVDLVVLDPPRAGCAPPVFDALDRARPGRILYVSCDPQALGRDVVRLAESGYRLIAVEPVDEECNTLDDDCDGIVDNGFDVGYPCDGDDLDLCLDDVMTCAGCSSGYSDYELCNGLDDDCDGITDESCETGGPVCIGTTCSCIADTCACDGGGCMLICTESQQCTCTGGGCFISCSNSSTCTCAGGGCDMNCSSSAQCRRRRSPIPVRRARPV